MILIGMLSFGVQEASDTVNQLISLERVLQCTKIEPEEPLESFRGLLLEISYSIV